MVDRTRPASGGDGSGGPHMLCDGFRRRRSGYPLDFEVTCIVVILYPGDLLKGGGEKIRTSIRHFDPQTVKQWHRDEAIRML
ncbi:unnamed protein product, partial [Closterium sp. NIES-53]